MYNRILIIGEAGRGKSTFAKSLSIKTSIPMYSTDDYFWKTKFTEANDRQKSIEEIARVYAKDTWIVEGGSQHLIKGGFERADVILYLQHRSIISQYYILIKRKFSRNNESFKDLLQLLKHSTYKRFGIGYKKGKPTTLEMIEPYTSKLIIVSSFKEMENFLSGL